MEDTREDDHIVREIPVFLSKTLADKLYLIQYPLRPATADFKDATILEARVKPEQGKIQLKLEVDIDSGQYDRERGELWAARSAGQDDVNEDEPPELRAQLDYTMMEATCIPKLSKSSRYVVGVIKGDQLHISPLKSIVQMKPILPYLDKADARISTSNENMGDTEDEGEEEATKVTVKFSRSTRDVNTKDKPSKNYNSVRKREEDEPWVELTYHHSDTEEYEKLFSRNLELESESPFYVLPQDKYLELLFPKYKEIPIDGSEDKRKHLGTRVTVAQLQQMPLSEQLRVLMLNGKVLRYNQIIEFLRTKLRATFDEVSLLRSIQTVAILVQGCWVVRSDLIYEADFVSSSNGITGLLMQRARDVVLSQFNENRIVERKKIVSLARLPHEEVSEILSQVSKLVPQKGWEFLLNYDIEFVSKYPEVVQRQTLIWEVKNQQKNRKMSEKDLGGGNNPLKPPLGSPPRRRSRNKSHSSDNDSGAESERGGRRGGGTPRQRRNSGRSDLGIPSKAET